jgi:hypothetical protein
VKDFITRLEEKTAEFGNHHLKYIHTVRKNLDHLIQRLEEAKKRDVVHILHSSYNFAQELRIVSSVAHNAKERLTFLQTFFSLHFLLMNRHAIDLLRMDVIASEVDRCPVYKEFMINAGNSFRNLTACYIEELLDLFLDGISCPEFVIMGVGTKADQDDIDVGIVDDCKEDRAAFNRVIALVSQTMLKSAISFHFHLSEHIGEHFYSASIEEYNSVLKHEIRDYVIINEMLSAAVITGSKKLFDTYRREVIDRYFYHANGENKYHEGYLRGILGEVDSLIARPISPTHISFKEDALRAIKSVICAQKTVFNIDKVNAWGILDSLKQKNAKRYHEYTVLEGALTFFEIFRYLYQLFVTQDEEISLDDTSRHNIRKVSRVLGYSDFGTCRAEEHLLVHYYEHMQNIRRTIPVLINDMKKHLETISLFVPMLNPHYDGNIAQDFLRQFRFFRGTSFWDDILDDFSKENVLMKFVSDLNSYSKDRREKLVKGYIEWVKYDFFSLIKFLNNLGTARSGKPVFEELNAHLLETLTQIPDIVRNIAYVFNRFPRLINRYFALNSEKVLRYYKNILETQTYEKDIEPIINNLRYLIDIHSASSAFYKRFFMRILNRYPEAITQLQYTTQLEEFADAIYSDIDSMPTFKEKKERLNDYYDFEMMRVGLKTLSGVTGEQTNADFTEFSDKYILTLFDICRQEIDKQYTKRIITDDLLAVFAAGGHAREQAYDDDYDIIVLLNTENTEVLDYCNKIIVKMNNEIIKRGTIPHHRFADYFGRFVILLDEIDTLLSEDRRDIFVEKSQMLGARLVIGSHRFEKEYVDRIVKSHIFEKREQYIAQMKNEIMSRHSMSDQAHRYDNDIKESTGGLRDIEMMMFIIKAQFNIMEPVNSKLFNHVARIQPGLKNDLYALAYAFGFLNTLRNIYRLTAGASDTIIPDALKVPARIMGFEDGQELHKKFTTVRSETKTAIDNLIQSIGEH